ncbi:MAG: DNA polymerase II large subunit [Euryarchaeota archaeon]|nr:DNA polymerase II large subunit [Euryarchaeota archaeon]
MKAYFDDLHAAVDHCYDVAKQARAKGYDPSLEVEILPAEDLAARVEAQVGVTGVAEDIRKVTKEIGNRELVSLEISRRVARGDYVKYGSREEAVDKAVRTGLSILTEGVLVAPLEGIAVTKIGKNEDGTDYIDLYFAGPIRAAGGTAQAMSVLIADVVRNEMGIGRYIATVAEIERYKEEVPAYKQAANLQYTPSAKEIVDIVANCPICINGEGTEQIEVTGNRDLPRVETNQIRGGAMLVLCEGMCLKAPKIQKHVGKLGLPGWDFLDTIVSKTKKDDEPDVAPDPNAIPEILPNPKYIREIIAGRPVFGHPSRPGGFRLRYGRGRTAGLASSALHPAIMPLSDDFIAVGTQLKIERPGKGTIATPCSVLDGPIVLLRNGDVMQLRNTKDGKRARPFVAEILDMGELLMPFGEFAENNHLLPRSPWVNEWFREEVRAWCDDNPWPDGLPDPEALIAADEETRLDAAVAYQVAEATGLPLAPSQTLLWHDLSVDEVRRLSDHITSRLSEVRVVTPSPPRSIDDMPEEVPDAPVVSLPADPELKKLLEKICLLHRDLGDHYEVTRAGHTLLRSLGLGLDDAGQGIETERRALFDTLDVSTLDDAYPSVDLVSRLSGVLQHPKAPFRIGARMGRPEKADARKMKPPPHALFPLGQAGGSQRLVNDAAFGVGRITVEVGKRRCASCGEVTFRTFCTGCDSHTEPDGEEPEEATIRLAEEVRRAADRIGIGRVPKKVKGVVGLISKLKVPEPLEKGLLRAQHGVYAFKDGTVRFDMTDAPLTHFRPDEIGVEPERLVELGYTHDIDGAPLERGDQMLELMVQDVVVPYVCADYLLACARFIDDLLERFYRMERFYGADSRHALVGHLIGGLAPHTSGAIASRIIGFTKSPVGWAHPYFHAGKRRNCDGDEDAVFLLMDGLLNFSRAYVPDRRGGLMDLPLVLTTRLDPNEIDKEAHNVDTLAHYPLSFYRATLRHKHPKDVEAVMGLVAERVGTPLQYEGLRYTHETPDISEGVLVSAYKTIPDMMDKLYAQFNLAAKIRAVDDMDVASTVIGSHFMPDLIGNLKAFSKQKVRCPLCNAKYRRFPLKGSCLTENCKGKLTLTVHEGSVKKYLEPSKDISRKYNVSAYTQQRIHLAEKSIESLFSNDKVKKARLSDFL